MDVRGPGFNSQAMPTAKTEKAEQNKKATPKSHQRALAALTRDEQDTGTLLSRGIKTPASPRTELSFRVTLAVHKLIPAESTFGQARMKSQLLVPPQGS